MTIDPYCDEKGTPPGSTAYYRRLFAHGSRQAAITALYAFSREVGSIADDVSEADAAHMKAAWWQAEVERLYAGAPRHPVTRALLPAVEAHGLDRVWFDELIGIADLDIEHPGHADADALLDRVRRVAAVQRLESEICGYEDASTTEFAELLGMALELSRILRDVRADAEQGRVHIPVDELEHHGARPADLLRAETGDSMRALLSQQAARACEYLDRAEEALPAIDHRVQTSGLVALTIQRALVAEIERDGYRVLEHRVDLTPIRKFWLAWRTARRARRTSIREQRNPAK